MSTRVLLVRHAESTWNAQQRMQGQADPPLSERGVRQASLLAEVLSGREISAMYTSPLKRAHITAVASATPHELQPCLQTALVEIHLGVWQGRPYFPSDEASGARAKKVSIDDPAIQAPGGETLCEALIRIGPALDEMVAHHQDETIVLVTHSIIGRIALCHLLGVGLELVPRLKLKLASISQVRVTPNGAVLERLGDTSHLCSLQSVRTLSTGRQQMESRR